MTKHYPECDSFDCYGCPREPTCDIRDDIEVEPPDESPDLPGMILAECVDDNAKLREDLDSFKAEIEGIIAAVVKAAAGEGR